MIKRILIFILLLMLSYGCGKSSSDGDSNRFSVPALGNWNKESGIRVEGAVSSCTIRLNDGRYRMFYPSMGGIGSSISSDGITFTEEAGIRISKGSGTDYDVNGAKDPDIVSENAYYRMYYVGIGPDNKRRVMSATSNNGLDFTKETGIRIDYTASYDELADVPSVVKVSDDNYKMYYVYDHRGDNSLKGAISTDGLNWEVKTLTGFTKNCMDPEVIMDSDVTTIVMYFAAPRADNSHEPMDIYKATSTDGINWKVVGQAIKPEKSEEGQIVGDADIVKLPDNTYRMYYYGMIGEDSDILSATTKSL